MSTAANTWSWASSPPTFRKSFSRFPWGNLQEARVKAIKRTSLYLHKLGITTYRRGTFCLRASCQREARVDFSDDSIALRGRACSWDSSVRLISNYRTRNLSDISISCSNSNVNTRLLRPLAAVANGPPSASVCSCVRTIGAVHSWYVTCLYTYKCE